MRVRTLARPVEKTENGEAVEGRKRRNMRGTLARSSPETAPTLGDTDEKKLTDKGWFFE